MIDNIPNTQVVASLEDKLRGLQSQIHTCKKKVNECEQKILEAQQEVAKKEAEIETIKQEAMAVADERKAQVAKGNQFAKELEIVESKVKKAKELRSHIANFISNLSQDEMDSFFVELLGDAQDKSKTHMYLLDRREKMSAEEQAFFSQDDSNEEPFATQEGEAFSFRMPE